MIFTWKLACCTMLLAGAARGNIYNNRDCRDWGPPQNKKDYPKWPYCNRRPGDGNTRYQYLIDKMPPADIPPYTCKKGVLRHDADGIVCANYVLGDDYAGKCTDATCCVAAKCDTYTCPTGWTQKSGASSVSCYFECNTEMCCKPSKPVPKKNAAGLIFVDRDPGRFRFGGEITILRAPDERDITHYRVYWGFGKMVRKVPSCGLKNPVSWETTKFKDETRLLKEVKKTGCDIRFTIPMGTKPPERCPISWDRKQRTTSGTDQCNPHYLIVVSVNANGEYPVMSTNEQQVGARHPISDYEDEFDLPCAEGGITMGHDIPGPDDIILGKWNQVPTAKMCAQLCRDYTGPKPCRYWTWSYPTGGRSAESCWIEAQVMQKTHYGVRVVGPAVCPTKDGEKPTGKERPRCNRWVRYQRTAPFDGNSKASRNAWKDQGALIVQEPHFPDVPLGPFDNAEECQALCDMDVLCIGFVFMKRDPSDAWFHKCMMIHVDNGVRKWHGAYDMWMCSREGMAPLINGYKLLANPFGWTRIEGATLKAAEKVVDHDCCATRCEEDSRCGGFTFSHTQKTCALYASPLTTKKINRVEGCAYESCFDTYGAASYEREGARMHVLDRWPLSGGDAGIPIIVQTNGHMEGMTVWCVLHRGSKTDIPDTAELMQSKLGASRRMAANVTGGIAKFDFMRTMKLNPVGYGMTYVVKCAVEKASQLGITAPSIMTLDSEILPGYNKVGDGYCKSTEGRKCMSGYVADTKKKPYSLNQCKAKCDADPNCEAFWRRFSDGHCTIAHKKCTWTRVNPDTDVQCWRKYTGANVHSIGKDMCDSACDGTCNFERQLGVYDRNVFIKNAVCSSDECDADPCGADQTCSDASGASLDFTCTCKSDSNIKKLGGSATCVKDECNPSPCGSGQSCSDPDTSPQSIKDFVCTCDNDPGTKATGAIATCVLNECDSSPCGADQTCNDPDTKYSTQQDYECTCKADSTISKIGGQPTCVKDECDASPCGSDQTCADTSTSPHHIKDFVCTCKTDSATKATGAAATCVLNECDGKPCGSDQTCNDPNTKYSAQRDYVCTCKADTSISKIGGIPVCVKDECANLNPCGTGQSCVDPSTSPHHIKDFICTCDNDVATKATGAAATCVLDECNSSPCGSDQTCNDPDTKYSSHLDFECVCKADGTIKKIGSAATCIKDECAGTNPCGSGQSCVDPSTSPHHIKDFVCTCDSDPATKATGASASCVLNECNANPCGSDQTCNDPDTKYSAHLDFVCTCTADNTITKIGGQPTCVKDECAATPAPCGSDQTCTDPSTSPHHIKDFVCTCKNDASTKATGAPTKCVLNECDKNPCGSGQTCNDPDTKVRSLYDFTCTCDSDPATVRVKAAAVCTIDECTAKPCGTSQTCVDASTKASSSRDFTCQCPSNGPSKVGGVATCSSGGTDECGMTPCGAGQSCTDTDTSTTGNFFCQCTTGTGTATGNPATCVLDECLADPCPGGQTCSDPDTTPGGTNNYKCTCNVGTGSQVNGPATCVVDECLANPCGSMQTCNDPDPSSGSSNDFTCTCGNGVKATGAAATCEKDECSPNPCGAGQSCNDPNTKYTEQHDYVCTCDADNTLKQIDGPAVCTLDECDRTPCGTGQVCNDPDKSVHVLKDFTCACSNGVKSTGGIATCTSDECDATPCGPGQSCEDPNTTYTEQHDYICTCDNDNTLKQIDGPAVCTLDECVRGPCGNQTCIDGNTSVHSLKDFTCECDNGVKAVGGLATCEFDECSTTPCGPDQSCEDPNTTYTEQHDYICTCDIDDSLKQIDDPAVCMLDECTQLPCGSTQTCNDPNTSFHSLKDFTCECDNGVKATGGAAKCVYDECLVNPCGAEQSCVDPNTTYTEQHDYICTCDIDDTLMQIDGPALCDLDECAKRPCGTNQTCNDPNKTMHALKDYTCTCTNGVEATGGIALCVLDECAKTPCGAEQVCFDPDTRYTVQHDFRCECANDKSVVQVDGPAMCVLDECEKGYCGNQTCHDPDTRTARIHDFVCSCENGATAVGRRANCDIGNDECLANPCAAGEMCEDSDLTTANTYTCTRVLDECLDGACGNQSCVDPVKTTMSTGDFVCRCVNGVGAKGRRAVCTEYFLNECENEPCVGDSVCVDDDRNTSNSYVCKAAASVVDECLAKPCGEEQNCKDPDHDVSSVKDYICSCQDGDKTSAGSPADCSSSSSSYWIYIIIAASACFGLTGLVIAVVIKKRRAQHISLDTFADALEEFGTQGPVSSSPSENMNVYAAESMVL